MKRYYTPYFLRPNALAACMVVTFENGRLAGLSFLDEELPHTLYTEAIICMVPKSMREEMEQLAQRATGLDDFADKFMRKHYEPEDLPKEEPVVLEINPPFVRDLDLIES